MAEEKKSMSVDEVKTLHELLRLAIDDLKLCYADPNVKVDMGEWLTYDGGTCKVCLAGAVMLKSQKNLMNVPSLLKHWALALDCLRRGDLPEATFYFHFHLKGFGEPGYEPYLGEEEHLEDLDRDWTAAGHGTVVGESIDETPNSMAAWAALLKQLEERYEWLKKRNL